MVKIFGYIVVLALAALISAFTLQTMWTWFIVPLGVMSIGYAHAWGVGLLLHLIVWDDGGKKYDTLIEAFSAKLAANFIVLVFGFIAHSLM